MKRYRSLKSADEALKLLREKISKTEEGGAKPLKLLQHKQEKQPKKRTRKQQKSLEEMRSDRAMVESIINSQIEKDKQRKYLNTTPKLQILKKEPLPTIPSLPTQDTQNKEEDLKKIEEQERAKEIERAKKILDEKEQVPEKEQDPKNKDSVIVDEYKRLSTGDLLKLIEEKDKRELSSAPTTALAEHHKRKRRNETPRLSPLPSPKLDVRTPPSVVAPPLPPRPDKNTLPPSSDEGSLNFDQIKSIELKLAYPDEQTYEGSRISSINDNLHDIIKVLKIDLKKYLSAKNADDNFYTKKSLLSLHKAKMTLVNNVTEFVRVFNEIFRFFLQTLKESE